MTDYPSDTLQKILAICGIVGPIIYAIVLTVLGMMWPGYNPISQFMSELGAVDAPHGIIMNTFGFSLLGIFIILFGFSLYRGISKHIIATICAILIIIAGIFMFAVGFFPCDPGCNNVTLIGKGHIITSTIPAIVMPLAILIIAYPLRKDSNWQSYWWLLSLMLGIVAVILSPLTMFPIFAPVGGLVQRLGMGVPLFWMFLMSIKLYLLTRS
ncbi:MAG: DUF998 domain-containing protein [Candidatus Methanofastidiosia archaeon]